MVRFPTQLPRRFLLFFGLTAGLALLLWGIYAKSMLFPSTDPTAQAAQDPVERGPILDREGRLLAVSSRLVSATVWRPQVPDVPALARTLAPILGEDEAALTQRLTNGPDFQYLKRKLSSKEEAALRELKSQKGAPGVHLEPAAGRSYPEGDLAGPLVGYVGLDNVGLAGIEYSFNDVLAPPTGEAGSRTGASVWLTIDSVLQHAVQTIAEKARTDNQATRVNLLVVEASTGDLVAWVSTPGFDPNRFSQYSDDERSNPVLTRAYEPGSVFKVFSLSTLLDAGVLKPTDTFEANGFYQHVVPSTGEVIRINDLAVYGRIDVAGILEHSSNAGTGYASDKMDAPTFEAGLRKYGFGTPTGISLSGETPGLLRPSTTWSARSKPTIAIGQEIGVSALQIVQAATALANQGTMLRPQIVRKVVSPSGEVLVQNGRTEVRQVISAKTASEMLGMLKTTVELGTGRRARVEGYDMAGKTGTAQVRDPRTGRYSEKNYIASLLLYLPADDPQYIIYLTIENPQGASYLGGMIAAPVGKTVAEKIIQLRGLPKNGEPLVDHPGSAVLAPPPALVVGQAMPDLKGLSKRSLLPLLNRPGLRVEIRGEGWVASQSPAPGTPLTDGSVVTVDLQ
jgi:cell division protein FtsI (penicillin-binding protein 3)